MFFTNEAVVRKTIKGKELAFYEASFGMVHKMKNLAKPIISAIATLLTDRTGDSGLTRHEHWEPKAEALITQSKYEAISAELASLRAQQRQAAIDQVVEVLMDKDNLMILTEIIADSLREDFKRDENGEVTEEDVKFLAQQMTAPVFVEMVKAVATANKDVFGPLAQRLSQAVSGALESQPNPRETTTEKSPTDDASQKQNQPTPGQLSST